MTVRELINLLGSQPSDAEVVVLSEADIPLVGVTVIDVDDDGTPTVVGIVYSED